MDNNRFEIETVCWGRPGQRTPFASPAMLVGRSPRADIRIDDHSVSRSHCRLLLEGESLFVEDVGSTNGTWLMGRRLDRRTRLPLNTPLRVGEVVLRVVVLDDAKTMASSLDGVLCEFKPLEEWERNGGDLDSVEGQFHALEALLRFQWGTLPAGKARFECSMLESFLSMTGASNALLLEYDSTTGQIVARGDVMMPLKGNPPSRAKPQSPSFDQRIAEHAMTKGAAVSARTPGGVVVCLPLLGRHHLNGLIYLEGVADIEAASLENMRFWTLSAMVAGASIEHMRLVESSHRSEALLVAGLNAAEFSHCVKNIISSMDAAMKLLTAALRERQLDRAEEARMLLAVNQRRLGNLVLDILTFSGTRRPRLEEVDLQQLVGDVVETLKAQFAFNRVELRCLTAAPGNHLQAELDPAGLRRVLMNLLANAEEAAMSRGLREPSHKGVVSVSAGRQGDSELAIAVEDNGAGVDPAVSNRLFTPFLSTKGTHGTGLGLHVSRKIVEAHGGSIRFEPVEGGGARFVVTLPVSQHYTETDTCKMGHDGQTLFSIPSDPAG